MCVHVCVCVCVPHAFFYFPAAVPHVLGHRDMGTQRTQKAFFALSFETNPLDSKVDTRVRLALQPLEVVYLPDVLERVLEFAAVPAELSALDDVASAAAATAHQWQQQTSTGLMYAIGASQSQKKSECVFCMYVRE